MNRFLQLFFCKHTNWSVVDEKGYQYCGLCGIAKLAPPPPPPLPCPHPEKEIIHTCNVFAQFTGKHVAIVFVQKCKQCGDLINHRVDMSGTWIGRHASSEQNREYE